MRRGHCVGVGNGTDALFLALLALGVGPGDEVITAANSFVATAEAITMTGATPVFIDCDPNRYTLDLNQVENALTSRAPRVKAIVPVHLYGLLVDMPRLMDLARKAGVKVLEDAAQAHDARSEEGAAGSFGDMAAFSFYPGKNLGAFGDGGAVVTRDAELAEQVRKLANHGRVGKSDHVLSGHNSRLDTLQAAVLSVKLRHLPAWSESRRELTRRYVERLAGAATGWSLRRCPRGGNTSSTSMSHAAKTGTDCDSSSRTGRSPVACTTPSACRCSPR